MTQIKDKKGKCGEFTRATMGDSREKECLREPALQSTITGGKISIDYILKVDKRGLIVLPKEIREKLDVGCSGKLLLMTLVETGRPSSIVLIPVERLFERATK